MYLLDNTGNLVDSEFSLDVLDGSPCVIVESSGGASPRREVARRNPDYNKLVSLLIHRLSVADIQIEKIILDSAKVAKIPVADRVVVLNRPYPIDISAIDVEELRLEIGRKTAGMFQDSNAKSGGNSQKRLCICLVQAVMPIQLLVAPHSRMSADDIPDNSPGLTETERAYLRTARIGQGRFRTNLLEAYRKTCPVTGILHPELLVASHIKPWNACTNLERLDPNNGILLSALIDRLFDRGLITFNNDGSILPSPVLCAADREKAQLHNAIKFALSSKSQRFMEYHRVFQFKRE